MPKEKRNLISYKTKTFLNKNVLFLAFLKTLTLEDDEWLCSCAIIERVCKSNKFPSFPQRWAIDDLFFTNRRLTLAPIMFQLCSTERECESNISLFQILHNFLIFYLVKYFFENIYNEMLRYTKTLHLNAFSNHYWMKK